VTGLVVLIDSKWFVEICLLSTIYNGQGSLTEGEGLVQLTSLYLLVLISSFLIKTFTKHVALMRRSTVLSLPLNSYSLHWSMTTPATASHSRSCST